MERGEDVILTGGLQPIPRDPKDNGVVAMLVLLTKGAMRNLLFMITNMAAMTSRANQEINEHQVRMSAYAHVWNKDKVP